MKRKDHQKKYKGTPGPVSSGMRTGKSNPSLFSWTPVHVKKLDDLPSFELILSNVDENLQILIITYLPIKRSDAGAASMVSQSSG